MKIAPESTSSSPASMRSEVDLPQPEGPTRTRNSPSSISRSRASTAGRSAFGKTRVACWKVTVAMGWQPIRAKERTRESSLHRALHDAAHDLLAQDGEDDQHRQRAEQRAGHDDRPLRHIAGTETGQRH